MPISLDKIVLWGVKNRPEVILFIISVSLQEISPNCSTIVSIQFKLGPPFLNRLTSMMAYMKDKIISHITTQPDFCFRGLVNPRKSIKQR